MTCVVSSEPVIHFQNVILGDKKTPLQQHRLDHCLISDELQEHIKIYEIIPSVQSDHSTLIMKMGSIREEAKRQA